uniref:Dolichyl-diphosphooligosaccharide--protein glycosyltransferase subunit STT3A n=1 Tax=Heterorhabditis bacteriophora TaxID=37862 RepID=A0A1I7X666_HETBA
MLCQTIAILSLAGLVAFILRLFAVIRFESVIHEFDPYFNYRTTRFLTEKGYYNFHNWFDDRAWYPLGRIIGGTIYPGTLDLFLGFVISEVSFIYLGLMVTAATLHGVLHYLNFTVHIRDVCVFLAPLFSAFTVMATYLLTKELKNTGSGLVAASLVAIVPGYISRSVAGSYDNEGIAIFCMLFTYYLWIRSVKTGSIYWSAVCAIAYFYMVSSWGGYVFLINLMPLHILVLIITGRFNNRHYIAWSTVYTIGTILSMQIPFVGFQPVLTSEHMGALGVFGLCQLVAFSRWLRCHLSVDHFTLLFRSVILAAGGIMFATLALATFFEKVAPWTGRFYSLLDPSYAKNNIPIIASVSEHQPTAWSSFFFDLHFLVFTFPVGLYFCFKDLNDHNIFVIMYGVTSMYFSVSVQNDSLLQTTFLLSGVMVRLMLVLAPVMCILGGIAINGILSAYMKNLDAVDYYLISPLILSSLKVQSAIPSKKEQAKLNNYPYKSEYGLLSFFLCCIRCNSIFLSFHYYMLYNKFYRSGSGGNIIFDDFRESYFWLRQNTPEDARIMSWWDYGYQISAMANRTGIVDNNTWNNTHISRVGQAMASNESHAIEIMRELDVDYVLIIFGGMIGYSSDGS